MADHPVNIEKANIAELRVKLNSINKEKEVWFKKKEDLKLDINKLVSQIKEFKSKRDKANISVSELKKQRDTYNSQVKSLISQLKTLNKEKYSVLKKYNIKGGVLALRFGDTAYTGATVCHLHFHLIVPKKSQTVNFPIG